MNTPSSINQLSSNSLPGYLPEPSSGRFDSSAPKFTYKRQVGSFTRKISRVRKGDVLQIGKSSSPSVKKRKGSAYPWTKPMQNWERVYVGKGKFVGKGRTKRSSTHKKNTNYKDLKKLSTLRIEEAKVLLDNNKYSGSYYLAGYSIELALKALWSKNVPAKSFVPNKKIYNKLNI